MNRTGAALVLLPQLQSNHFALGCQMTCWPVCSFVLCDAVVPTTARAYVALPTGVVVDPLTIWPSLWPFVCSKRRLQSV
jgi:hypothetical protein